MQTIANFDDRCGECPVWDQFNQVLYWTDCAGLRFYRYDPQTNAATMIRSGIEINGFRLTRGGAIIAVSNTGIWKWDAVAPEMTLLTAEIESEPCRLNDCVADPAGRLIAGSWFYDPAANYRLGKLIQYSSNGTGRGLDDGFHLANGLAFSPAGDKLYATDSVARLIYQYDYSVETGIASNKRVLVKVPSTEGLPDGLRVDREGFLWSAQWYGSCIVRYDPDGRQERRINVPAKQVSCLTFGGPNLGTLFITTAGLSEPMPVMPPGYDAANGYFGGSLYQHEAGIQGLPDARLADF